MKLTISKQEGMTWEFDGYRVPSIYLDNPLYDHSDKRFRIDVEVFIHKNKDGDYIFQVMNGVTGFESFNMERLLKNHKDRDGDFLLCAGTKNRWDRLAIFEWEWDLFVREYGHLFRSYSCQ